MKYIAWTDIETTGLDEMKHVMLELAIVITDAELEVLCSRSWLIRPTALPYDLPSLLIHNRSGLLSDALEAGEPLEAVLSHAVQFLSGMDTDEPMPMGGFSVHFDRRWLKHHMPELHSQYKYRNIDVSTIRELAKEWYSFEADIPGGKAHRALPDCLEAIETLRQLRTCVFRGAL